MFERWSGEGGYRQILVIGMPMLMGMVSSSVMQFTDRIFLGNYSLDAIAASLPASIVSFMFVAFFMGVAEYLSVFVAQYTGAARLDRVGASLWQGIWFCVPSCLFLASLAFIADPLFAFGGHPAHLQALESEYFKVLTIGGGLVVITTTLSGFYSGRGITLPVMFVNMMGALVNIPLDYALINGWGPFPELGIFGAGLATVTGQLVMVLLLVRMIFTRENECCFSVRSKRKLEPELFMRYLRFGLPGGLNFFVDMFAVTFFVFMVGRVGDLELAATNMVVSLDLLAFLPCIGLSIATGVVVGQSIGAGKPEVGERATMSSMHICLLYMGCMALSFVIFPTELMELFRERGVSEAEYAQVLDMGTTMLRFVAVYSLFDAVVLTLFGALKGAGDIRFVMWSIITASAVCMVLPISLLSAYTDMGYVEPWTCLTIYIITLTTVSWIRFRKGKWKTMHVIEKEALAEMADR